MTPAEWEYYLPRRPIHDEVYEERHEQAVVLLSDYLARHAFYYQGRWWKKDEFYQKHKPTG